MIASPNLTRRAVLCAAGLILLGSAGIQTSSAISAGLFSSYGTFGTSALRMIIAALVLLLLVRPSLRGRERSEWMGIVVYGVAMALMNLCLYNAIDRLPLGVAVTLDFLGPCAVALMASRRLKEGLCAGVSLLGVALISAGPWGYFDLIGYAAGLGAAFFFGLYTVFAAKVGKAGSGLDGLALSVTVAALITLPLALPHLGQVSVSG
ncbi:EamA family transporter [Corynebacterium lowii]|uniref:Threonine/homoserine exporter RhtA n=1 Tax=Corynebacterium lowii TaxID=1544413 RepID=A0A0Q0U3N6_9CORY|nr:EamA family transporter [Corynebacterium lowii]KQB86540.1 Threonine/homoserine exporter RhtA [Corynebacterium lowii]MDP9851220.1 inner membrane transporter RhtA [Corynebacterium lowii]